MRETILSCLPKDFPWRDRFLWLPSTDSTNDQLRKLARQGAPEGTILLAGHQTGGHGRRGRSFHSPADVGIYMSILLRPNCAPTDLMHLTCATAVAMCDAVEKSAGFRPGIKWTNDLVFGKRKLGGILTELGFTPGGGLGYAIIGVGINCSQQRSDFPEDIRSIAGSLSSVTGSAVDRSRVAAAMMEAFHKMSGNLLSQKESMLAQYRADCITLGQEISLVRGEEIRHGKALDVDDSGALIVAFPEGTVEAVNSGEVSVRGMYGYL